MYDSEWLVLLMYIFAISVTISLIEAPVALTFSIIGFLYVAIASKL